MLPAPGGSAPAPKPKRRRTTTGGGSTSTGTHFGATRSPAPSYNPPPKPAYNPPRGMPQATAGVTSGGGSRGRSVGAPTRPSPPSEASFLHRDVGYQQALREFRLNMQQFLADKTRQTTSARSEYQTNLQGLATQRTRDIRDINADFTARGLLHSGLLASRLGEYEQDYLRNRGSYTQQYNDFLKRLSQAQTQLSSQQRLESEKARQEALARRATRYGL